MLGMVVEAVRGALQDVRSGETLRIKFGKSVVLGRTLWRETLSIFAGLPYGIFAFALWKQPERFHHRWRFSLVRNVKYGPRDRNRVDVYTPMDSDNPGLLPVVMFVHGGVWASGDVFMFSPMGATLAHHGMVAVLVEYTLYPTIFAKEQALELSRALTWIHDNVRQFGGDPENVCLVGHSSGAHLCGMLFWERAHRNLIPRQKGKIDTNLPDGRHPKCYAALSGVYNIGDHYNYERGRGVEAISCMKPAMEGPENFSSMSPELLFRKLLAVKSNSESQASKDIIKDIYPEGLNINSIDWSAWARSTPPFISLASDNDVTVPPGSSIKFTRVLRDLGCRAGVRIHESVGHGDFVCWVNGLTGESNGAAEIVINDIVDIAKKETSLSSFYEPELRVTDSD